MPHPLGVNVSWRDAPWGRFPWGRAAWGGTGGDKVQGQIVKRRWPRGETYGNTEKSIIVKL